MTINGKVFEADALKDIAGVRHGFFTREGGVSGGVYASLNCGYGSGDTRDAVAENRLRVARHLGGASDDIVTVHQSHSAEAIIVDALFTRDHVPRADAVVTRTPGLAVGALAADCTPVLFAEPSAGVIAAAHAGWRGALSGILQSTVAAIETLGGQRGQIRAVIGPTIYQAAYEVGPEFEKTFLDIDPNYQQFFQRPAPDSRPYFDLPGFCRHQLENCGVGAISAIPACTYENESLLFSYRRTTHRSEPDYGRQISAIVLS